MKSEDITLREMESGDFSVEVNYYFSGFLFFPYSISFPETADFELKNFKRVWNDKIIPVEKNSSQSHYQFSILGSSYHSLHESTLPRTFSLNSILTDRYEFTPPILEFSSKTEIPKGKYIEYILRTGSGWRGEIGKIETHIYFKNSNCSTIKILPQSYYGICKDKFHWYAIQKNCKPNKNIRLVLPLQ